MQQVLARNLNGVLSLHLHALSWQSCGVINVPVQRALGWEADGLDFDHPSVPFLRSAEHQATPFEARANKNSALVPCECTAPN